MCRLRHINDPVLSSLNMEGILFLQGSPKQNATQLPSFDLFLYINNLIDAQLSSST
jgi:hypothetical protein